MLCILSSFFTNKIYGDCSTLIKPFSVPRWNRTGGNFTKDFTTTAYILESSLNLKKKMYKDKKEAHVLCTSLRIMIRSTFETFWHGEQKECMASQKRDEKTTQFMYQVQQIYKLLLWCRPTGRAAIALLFSVFIYSKQKSCEVRSLIKPKWFLSFWQKLLPVGQKCQFSFKGLLSMIDAASKANERRIGIMIIPGKCKKKGKRIVNKTMKRKTPHNHKSLQKGSIKKI